MNAGVMTRLISIWALVMVSSVYAEEMIDFFSMSPAMPQELEVTNEGQTEYKSKERQIVCSDMVVIKADSGVQMYADHALIDLAQERVVITGNVSVYNGPILFKGERASYFYKTKKLDSSQLRTTMDPFLLQAGRMRTMDRDGVPVLVADQARLTTDDYQDPSYWITADRISIYPNRLATFKNMKLKIGGVPVLWFPYLAQSMDKDLGYRFRPGGQTHLGFFWRNRYGMHVGGERDSVTGRHKDPDYLLQWQLDPYSRRGVGLGATLQDLDFIGNSELGLYSAYWINDFAPTVEVTRENRSDLSSNRYRFEVKERRRFGNLFGEQMTLDTNLTWLSDEFFLLDFFQQQYRSHPQPDNAITLSHQHGRAVTTLLSRFQLNDFYEADTRLPELSFDWVRSPIAQTGILYESQTSLGYLKRSIADAKVEELSNELLTASTTVTDEIQMVLDEDAYLRGHTWHELSYPMQVGGAISVTPRLGGGYTSYHSNDGTAGRTINQVAVDTSLRLSKNYSGVDNRWLGLRGLTHVVQPYANLTLLEVSDLDTEFSPVDTLTPITRPRPTNVGRYSALDVLDDWSFVRTGLRHKFLTSAGKGQAKQWLYWDSYMDILLGQEDSDQTTSNLYNEFLWSPKSWVSLNLETQFPIADTENDFSEIYLGSSLMLGKSTELRVGYSFLENHPIVQDSNQVSYKLYHRVNDQWGISSEHRWQLDDNTLELQRYKLDRSVKSWIVSAEVFQRDFRVRKEFGFGVGFTVRDFPDISLPLSFQR